MRLGKLIKDYCDYPKPYKIIELCSPSSTATNLIEYYSDTPTLKQRNENGFLILEDSQRSRGDDKWGKPHSWSQVRYQHLFEIDTLESK